MELHHINVKTPEGDLMVLTLPHGFTYSDMMRQVKLLLDQQALTKFIAIQGPGPEPEPEYLPVDVPLWDLIQDRTLVMYDFEDPEIVHPAVELGLVVYPDPAPGVVAEEIQGSLEPEQVQKSRCKGVKKTCKTEWP